MRSLTKTAGWCVPNIPILARVHPERSRGAAHHLLQCLKFFLFTFLRTLLHFFCTLQKLNSFIFKRFLTLCKKKRGQGEGNKLLAENTARVSVVTSLLHYVFTSSSHRKQHRLGGWSISDGL